VSGKLKNWGSMPKNGKFAQGYFLEKRSLPNKVFATIRMADRKLK